MRPQDIFRSTREDMQSPSTNPKDWGQKSRGVILWNMRKEKIALWEGVTSRCHLWGQEGPSDLSTFESAPIYAKLGAAMRRPDCRMRSTRLRNEGEVWRSVVLDDATSTRVVLLGRRLPTLGTAYRATVSSGSSAQGTYMEVLIKGRHLRNHIARRVSRALRDHWRELLIEGPGRLDRRGERHASTG